jgi:hypothetical protein
MAKVYASSYMEYISLLSDILWTYVLLAALLGCAVAEVTAASSVNISIVFFIFLFCLFG